MFNALITIGVCAGYAVWGYVAFLWGAILFRLLHRQHDPDQPESADSDSARERE